LFFVRRAPLAATHQQLDRTPPAVCNVDLHPPRATFAFRT
jgi:hypothetical protein